jgi:hypothetical protein
VQGAAPICKLVGAQSGCQCVEAQVLKGPRGVVSALVKVTQVEFQLSDKCLKGMRENLKSQK